MTAVSCAPSFPLVAAELPTEAAQPSVKRTVADRTTRFFIATFSTPAKKDSLSAVYRCCAGKPARLPTPKAQGITVRRLSSVQFSGALQSRQDNHLVRQAPRQVPWMVTLVLDSPFDERQIDPRYPHDTEDIAFLRTLQQDVWRRALDEDHLSFSASSTGGRLGLSSNHLVSLEVVDVGEHPGRVVSVLDQVRRVIV